MHKFPQSFIPDQKILWRDRNEIFEDRLYFDPDFNNGRYTQVVDNQRQHAYRIFPKDLHKYLSTGLVKLDKNLQQNYIEGKWKFVSKSGVLGVQLV